MSKTLIKGRVYVVGDKIDTDQIIRAELLKLKPDVPEELEQLGMHAMGGLPEALYPIKFMEPGAKKSKYPIIVGGVNFGCGSSREHAPAAQFAAGVEAVVAPGFARIYLRNSINGGFLLPVESVDRLCDVFKTDDEAEIDLLNQQIKHLRDGTQIGTYQTKKVDPVLLEIIASGGIFEYMKKLDAQPAER